MNPLQQFSTTKLQEELRRREQDASSLHLRANALAVTDLGVIAANRRAEKLERELAEAEAEAVHAYDVAYAKHLKALEDSK